MQFIALFPMFGDVQGPGTRENCKTNDSLHNFITSAYMIYMIKMLILFKIIAIKVAILRMFYEL